MSFSDWWTGNNNPSLPKSEYLYGTRHIIVLVVVLISCIAFSVIFRKKSERCKNILFYTLGGIFLTFEILSRIINLITTDSYSFANIMKIILPMHICSIMVWVLIFAIFTKKKFLLEFAAIGGLLATLAFLLYPAVGLNKVYFSFASLYSTGSHALGFLTAILLMTLGRVKFKFKDIWQVFLCFVVMFSWGALLNFVIFPGSDYMYMINDPLELNLGAFPYQILYIIVISIYTISFYLISHIHRKIKARKHA